MHRTIRTAMIAPLFLLAAACGDDGGTAIQTTTIPTTIPSSLVSVGQEVAQSLCDNLNSLQSTLASLQTSPPPDVSDAADQLEQLGDDLRANANTLTGEGQQQLATVATAIATATDALRDVVKEQGTVPAAWEAGISAVSLALQQIPPEVCTAT
jgi:ABC-type transporter Mla subunit MlaD